MQTQSTRVLEQIISSWSHDIHHNDTQQYDTKHDDIDDNIMNIMTVNLNLSMMIVSIINTERVMTLNIRGLFVTVSMNDIQN